MATAKEMLWRERVREWRESGLSAARFAAAYGVTVSSLRAWARRVRRADAPRFVELVPVRSGSERGNPMVVEIAGARIHVGPGFDADVLSEVVRVLRDGAAR